MYTTNSLIYSKKLSQRISALISIPIDLCIKFKFKFTCIRFSLVKIHVFDNPLLA